MADVQSLFKLPPDQKLALIERWLSDARELAVSEMWFEMTRRIQSLRHDLACLRQLDEPRKDK